MCRLGAAAATDRQVDAVGRGRAAAATPGYGYTRDARRKTKKVGDPNLRPLKRTQRRVAMY